MKYGLDRPITKQDREAVMKALNTTTFKPVTTGTSSYSQEDVKVFRSDDIKAIIQQAMVEQETYEVFYGTKRK